MIVPFEKVSKHVKPKYIIEYFALGTFFSFGKFLLDNYYGRDIWEESAAVVSSIEGNPEFYISKEGVEHDEE